MEWYRVFLSRHFDAFWVAQFGDTLSAQDGDHMPKPTKGAGQPIIPSNSIGHLTVISSDYI